VKTKKPFFKTAAEFDAFKAKQRLELKKEMLAKTKGNPRVTLLTAGQVKKEWNIRQEELDQVPVAMVVNGKPMYTEFLVDTIARKMDVKSALAYNTLGVSFPRLRSMK
jgi:hypothetical protein